MNKVKLEFLKYTNILPLHPTNKLEDRCTRKDVIFNTLAEKIFDNPKLLSLLRSKIRKWVKKNKDEFTYCLAGYLYYFAEEFSQAEKYFLKAINRNPQNLDNWFDLAFALYHQDDEKHTLGKEILFNFDRCVEHFKKKKVNLKNLKIFFSKEKKKG